MDTQKSTRHFWAAVAAIHSLRWSRHVCSREVSVTGDTRSRPRPDDARRITRSRLSGSGDDGGVRSRFCSLSVWRASMPARGIGCRSKRLEPFPNEFSGATTSERDTHCSGKKPARYSIGIPGGSGISLYQAGIPIFFGILIPARYSVSVYRIPARYSGIPARYSAGIVSAG